MSQELQALLASDPRLVDAAHILNDVLGLAVPDLSALVDMLSQKSTLVNLYCSVSSVPGECRGLCENSDIAGPGVRASFYAQSLLNAILMAVSPDDAPAACWGATLLTAAVIIPSIMQKRAHEITLHHALVVLGFATMSTIATFASAPFCSFWRAADFPYVLENPRQTTSLAPPTPTTPTSTTLKDKPDLSAEVVVVSLPATPASGTRVNTPSPMDPRLTSPTSPMGQSDFALSLPEPSDFRRAKWNSPSYRSRVLLSVALITEISLTWSWAVYLFVDPHYAQTPCSGSTNVVFFWKKWNVSWINEYGPRYLLFPGWLLFCMLATLLWGIALVYASDVDFPLVEEDEIIDVAPTSKLNAVARMLRGVWHWCRRAAKLEDTQKRAIVFGNGIAGALWLFLMVNSEIQVRANVVFDENNDWGFGQISAMLLAAAPLWPITNALYRSWRQHTAGIRQHHTLASTEAFTMSPEQQPISLHVLPATPNDSSSDLRTHITLVAGSIPPSPSRRILDVERAEGSSTPILKRTVSGGSIPPSPTDSLSRTASRDPDQPDTSLGRHRRSVSFAGDPHGALWLDVGSSGGNRPILAPLDTGSRPMIVITPPPRDDDADHAAFLAWRARSRLELAVPAAAQLNRL